MTSSDNLLKTDLRRLLESVANKSDGPGSGTAAAVSVGLAAALIAMAGRRSRPTWAEAGAATGQAEVLRSRAEQLVQESAEAYSLAVELLASDQEGKASPEQRDWRLGVAVTRAGAVPLAIAEVGADVAELGAQAARACHPDVRADAAAACLLAEAGVRATAHLVEINLTVTPEDRRLDRCRELVDRTERARMEALPDSPTG